MGVFGNHPLPKGRSIHIETETDIFMNYFCGGIFLAVVIVGITVNTRLIQYYRDRNHRTSWIHKFYLGLAVACLVYMFTRGVPTTIRLFDSRISPVDSFSNWTQTIYSILHIFCYMDGAVITTIVALIVILQYKNIHRPGWILLHGPKKFWKPVLIGIGIFYLVCFASALILLLTSLIKDGEVSDKISFACKLLVEVPLLIITAVAPCVYTVTLIKFRRKERALSVRGLTRVRKDLQLVHVVIIWNALWFIATITYLNLLYLEWESASARYIIFICSEMLPLVEAMAIACSISIRDRKILDFTCRRAALRGLGSMDIFK